MTDAILIAAQSGRALAEAARRAGLRPLVADLFGDADTLALAEAYRPLPGRFGAGRLGGTVLLDALDDLAAAAGTRPIGAVLGSGFEDAPDLMAAIHARHGLLGAAPDAVAALKDPFRLAALCAELAVPHPAVAVEPRPDPANWLVKRVGGSGGSHIRRAGRGRAPPGAYFQARVPGRPHALNVLGDGRGIRVLALTEQWCAPSPLRPFRYGGALARGAAEPSSVPPDIAAEIAGAVARLVARTGLRGLASADCLVAAEGWWLTEINPRPGATLDVLDRRATPLILAHLAASRGGMPPPDSQPADAAAAEICYADRDLAPVPAHAWPDHVRDRPRAGTTVRRDAPLCTVLATGADAAETRETLRARATALRTALAQEEAPG
ncbi:hypothetical protein BHAOGJBA_0862 [Methylobacterium hispanicum]|uniref:ATP-grasp domain-containing protein n=2 Tax=Methylobacterium TaxID=407 RepID=A0AAV4ZHM9_9HYPH|nr:ATP-grasp domain-containing protein [Methylobacterium hispanicum]GJD87360.1 hypothetical protein BHAOGJBA_0862 [Methylobacterium hispanicum]